MHLNYEQSHLLAKLFAYLAEDWNEAQIRRHVGEALLRLLQADQYASFTWNDEAAQFGNEVFINMDAANIGAYNQYYQFRDPITPLLQRQTVPTLVSQVMPQRELMKTEFFNDFLKRDGLHHGINLYLWDQGHNIGDVRIWRSCKRQVFNEEHKQLLAHLQPALTAAIKRARGRGAFHLPKPSVQFVPTTARLAQLSGRRAQIAQCVIDGMTDKEIAKELDIGFATVRTHVSKLFLKMDVHNRTQLARLLAD